MNGTDDFEKTAVTDINATQAISAPVAERTTMSANVECPVCRTPNSPSEIYCTDCGFMLAQQPVEVETPPEVPSVGVLTTPDGIREFVLKPGENSVGRENADILLTHNSVSRKHAKIAAEDGRVTVEDLGSTNGTYVDGARIEPNTPTEVKDGCELRFGNEAVVVKLPVEAAAEPSEEEIPECEASADMEAYEAAEAEGDATVGEAPAEPVMEAPPVVAVARLKSRDGALSFDLAPGTYKLGRRQGENDIIIPDPYTSGRHADLVVEHNRIVLTDIGSSNGTIVNGAKIEPKSPCEVHVGDEITVGQYGLTLEAV
jgi:pSer/pThr/pTyr-binding forkhead associated (FHA) protein